ncbi:2874_t:CDS:2, partial [Gigaspora rosea]
MAFKGTTPDNLGEWMRNLTVQCVDGRAHLFGQIHQGFYEYLFPNNEVNKRDFPCKRIIEAIQIKAIEINKKSKKDNVNLWVTGHSLGGALATLFYAYLLKTNLGGLQEHLNFKGAITFASPAVGNHHFATQLDSLIDDPKNKESPLWRVVVKQDIVPKLPYRALDDTKEFFQINELDNREYCIESKRRRAE